MTTRVENSADDWDAIDLLKIINPDTHSVTCVGYAPSQRRRCRNRIAQHNLEAAKRLLTDLPQFTDNHTILRQQLYEIAALILCRHYHQYQAAEVSDRWHCTIIAETNRRNHARSHSIPDSTDAVMAEIRRLQRQMEDLLRRQQSWSRQPAGQSNQRQRHTAADASDWRDDGQDRERQQARHRAQERQQEEQRRRDEEQMRADEQRRSEEARRQEEERREEQRRRDKEQMRADEQRRREEAQRREEERREEARRQADRERSEREAEARQRAEQGRARREREEAARHRREQQAREQAERERGEWSDSWDRYDRDWANMSRIDTATVNEDVRDSLPWPVKNGIWQELTERNVEEFLKHAPDGRYENSRRFRTLLRQQALRWHEDKIRQFFPRVASDQEALRLTGVVMQVINRLTERL